MKTLFFLILAVATWSLVSTISWLTRSNTVVVETDARLKSDFVKPGVISRYYGPRECENVSEAPDRMWQLTLRDHWTKKEIQGEFEHLPPGLITWPHNMVRVRFISKEYTLKIDYVAPLPPRL